MAEEEEFFLDSRSINSERKREREKRRERKRTFNVTFAKPILRKKY
jgi:hypothetical protein